MPYKITPINHESPFGLTVQNHLYGQPTTANKLVIILPGKGYTTEHPALFHLRYVALQNGFDVLPVQYGFQAANRDLLPEEWPYLSQDVKAATDPVLTGHYQQICVVGKSLGTPLAIELANTISVNDVSLILLTPIGASMQMIGNRRTLAVIGTADSLYSEEMVRKQDKSSYLQWVVMEGLDHGLQTEDNWLASLNALTSIMTHCEEFLSTG